MLDDLAFFRYKWFFEHTPVVLTNGTPQPNVEEITYICIWDGIVIGWIGQDNIKGFRNFSSAEPSWIEAVPADVVCRCLDKVQSKR